MPLPHEQLAQSSRQIERSAGAVKESAAQLTDSADRRTELASDRTVLAMERTYAAWVRTGLAALASGVGAQPLLDRVLPGLLVSITGSVLILFSAFCFFAAVWRDITPVAPPRPEIRRLPRAALIVTNGFLGLVALAALVGVWFHR
jgi:putative membrane protein